MKLLPPLREQPRSIQFVLAIAVPALYGGLTGYFLGVSEAVYLVLATIGILGAVGAGFDHLGGRAGAGRGVVAGLVFGGSILIAHEIHGAHATAHLPEPKILLLVVTTGIAIPFAAYGGRLRRRVQLKEQREGRHEAEQPAPTEPEAAAAPPAQAAPPPASVAELEHALAEPVAAQTPAEPVATATRVASSDGGGSQTATAREGAVSLNTGSFEDFRSLGMSVTQAKRVIAYRDHLGGYASAEDLDKVPGFPKAMLAELKRELAA